MRCAACGYGGADGTRDVELSAAVTVPLCDSCADREPSSLLRSLASRADRADYPTTQCAHSPGCVRPRADGRTRCQYHLAMVAASKRQWAASHPKRVRVC